MSPPPKQLLLLALTLTLQSSTTKTLQSSQLIKTTCTHFHHPNFCNKILTLDPNNNNLSTLQALAYASMVRASYDMHITDIFIDNALRSSGNVIGKQGLEHCKVDYGNAFVYLGYATRDYKLGNFGKFEGDVNVVLFYVRSCVGANRVGQVFHGLGERVNYVVWVGEISVMIAGMVK